MAGRDGRCTPLGITDSLVVTAADAPTRVQPVIHTNTSMCMRHPYLFFCLLWQVPRCPGAYAQITSPPRLRPAPAPARPPRATPTLPVSRVFLVLPRLPHLSTATGATHEAAAQLAQVQVVDGAHVVGIVGDVGWI